MCCKDKCKCMKMLTRLLVLLALLMGVMSLIAMFAPGFQAKSYAIFGAVTRFFGPMIPILGVAALFKYIAFCGGKKTCCDGKKDECASE